MARAGNAAGRGATRAGMAPVEWHRQSSSHERDAARASGVRPARAGVRNTKRADNTGGGTRMSG
jgi:hypothetical protein